MILVGEAHPELPLKTLITSMGLEQHVRHLDFVPMEDFNGYLAACDIVLNLRYPTVGESSGTLLRALGMGKAVIVSDVGSFRELPDDICLKVPVDATEEEHLFEYLNLLATRRRFAVRWENGLGRGPGASVAGTRSRGSMRSSWRPWWKVVSRTRWQRPRQRMRACKFRVSTLRPGLPQRMDRERMSRRIGRVWRRL